MEWCAIVRATGWWPSSEQPACLVSDAAVPSCGHAGSGVVAHGEAWRQRRPRVCVLHTTKHYYNEAAYLPPRNPCRPPPRCMQSPPCEP